MTEVVPGILFRSARPGYPSRSVAEAEVAEWVWEHDLGNQPAKCIRVLRKALSLGRRGGPRCKETRDMNRREVLC